MAIAMSYRMSYTDLKDMKIGEVIDYINLLGGGKWQQ